MSETEPEAYESRHPSRRMMGTWEGRTQWGRRGEREEEREGERYKVIESKREEDGG